MNVGARAVLVGSGADRFHECLKGGKLLWRARVNRALQSDGRPSRKVNFHLCMSMLIRWLVQCSKRPVLFIADDDAAAPGAVWTSHGGASVLRRCSERRRWVDPGRYEVPEGG